MFLQTNTKRTISSEGPTTGARLAIVGEAPGAYEERTGKPFQGPAGTVLDQCLHSAGLIRSHCYLTNVVKERPEKNDISPYWGPKHGFTDRGQDCVDQLAGELAEVDAEVIVTMGNVPLAAVAGISGVTKVRGYPFPSTLVPGKTVVPCIHPAATLRGKYIWRYYIMHDLMRAARYAKDGAVMPKRDLIYNFTFDEACEWITAHRNQPFVSFDIEVIHYEVSCISFSSKSNYAVSIPFYGVWNAEEEAYLWKLVAELLEDKNVKKVGQNLMFDMAFLAMKNNILVRGEIMDTMVAHGVMYPDFEKGLGFLASIYTDQTYWKDMVSFKNIKKES